LSISNFGAGYSSLSHLDRFPIDFLVIDNSFVYNLWEGSADATVVSGMISLAHALGITAVAEWVWKPPNRLPSYGGWGAT
jgi:EAL domain-containing protein (putative c-di-GMP-specific phosphodiesterase class I)